MILRHINMENSLASKHFGTVGKPPFVILHGMLGSSRNWGAIGKALSDVWDVYALDLRNHGDSPWADEMSYSSMGDDVRRWIDERGFSSVCLLGHSLGGKVAMKLATDTPEYVQSLVVVDISLRRAKPRWDRELTVLRNLPLATMESRKEAESILEEEKIGDWAFRKFLLTNLERIEEGGFRCKANLPVIHANLTRIFEPPLEDDDRFTGPTLVIRGDESKFLAEEDKLLYERHFSELRWETVRGAGHNVHAEQPEQFLKILHNFGEYLSF